MCSWKSFWSPIPLFQPPMTLDKQLFIWLLCGAMQPLFEGGTKTHVLLSINCWWSNHFSATDLDNLKHVKLYLDDCKCLVLVLTYKSNRPIHRLLNAGLNPRQPDSAGMTPVHCCGLLGSVEAFQCLPVDCWNLPEENSGRCALHYAGISGNMDIVRYIIESGVL